MSYGCTIIPAQSLLAERGEMHEEIGKLIAKYNKDIADLQKLIDAEDQAIAASKSRIEVHIKRQDTAMAMVDQLNQTRKLYE